MMTMARYAMQYPLFRQVVDTKHYDVRESNISYTIYNVNPILSYPGADGVKTGFSDDAGRDPGRHRRAKRPSDLRGLHEVTGRGGGRRHPAAELGLQLLRLATGKLS